MIVEGILYVIRSSAVYCCQEHPDRFSGIHTHQSSDTLSHNETGYEIKVTGSMGVHRTSGQEHPDRFSSPALFFPVVSVTSAQENLCYILLLHNLSCLFSIITVMDNVIFPWF